MKGVKSKVMSVALCSAMAITTIGSDIGMVVNAEETVAETRDETDELVEEKVEADSKVEDEVDETEVTEETDVVETDVAEVEETEESETESEEVSDEKELKKQEDSEEDKDDEIKLIASFDFDNEESGFEGAGAKAVNHGVKVEDTELVKNAAYFNGENAYLEVEKSNGDSLLTGENEITISYLRQADKSGKSWTFFAAPNKNSQVYRSEKYLGVLDVGNNITVERYNSNNNDRPGQLSVNGIKKEWDHIVVVLGKDYTAVYENGKLKEAKHDYSFDTDMSKMLKDNSILQIGKANWDGGEYFGGYIDDYRIYEGAMNASEVADLFSQFEEKIAEKPEEPEVVEDELQADYDALEIFQADDVRGNITLPSEGKYGSKITWKSSDTDVITDKATKNDNYASTPAGVVTRQSEDTKVILTATVSKDGEEKEKEFEVTVKAKKKQEKTTDYLFAYFTGNTVKGENIFFAVSNDGLNYSELNDGKDVLTSTKGEKGLRDSFVMRSHEGDKFYLIATDLSIGRNGDWTRAQKSGSQAIMVWESKDLIHWGNQRMVTLTDTIEAGCTWAPEAYYDEITGEYVVFWASKTTADNYGLQRIYYSKTRDFNTFTEPKVWIDRKTVSTIDTTIVSGNDGYLYRISKNEGGGTLPDGTKLTASTVYMERSKSIFGEWEKVDSPSLEGIQGVEGPTAFKFNKDDVEEDTWCVLLDHFGGSGYKPVITTDIAKGKFKTPEEYALPSAPRHGTVLNITSEEYDALVKEYGIKEPEKDPLDMENIPDDVLYFIDSGANSSTKFNKISDKFGVLNETPDAIYGEDSSWGIVNEDEANCGKYTSSSDDVFSDGWWARGDKNCEYIVPLSEGEYVATGIFNEWWSVTRPMNFYVTYKDDKGKEVKSDVTTVKLSGSEPRIIDKVEFKVENVAKTTEVHFVVTPEKSGNPDPVISGLMISGTAQKAEEVEEKAFDTEIKLNPSQSTRFNDTDEDGFGEFQGWGTSLCWWANRIGYNSKLTKKAVEAIFGDKGLRLNIGRYNVGGGDDPIHNHIIRSDSGVPGYCVDVTKMDLSKHKLSYYQEKFDRADRTSGYAWNYDWSADNNQVNVLVAAAKASGDDFIAEAFSNSPPYFMTESGCSSGNKNANDDNLREDCVTAFACYMADVIEHLDKADNGVSIQSATPMNEPYTNYWQANSNKQEGCHFDIGESQSRVLVALNKELEKKGLNIIISASDETSIDTAIDSYNALSDEAKDVVTRIDTHTYSGSKRSALAKTAVNGGENLWMSEVDGSFTGGQDAGEMSAAIGMGARIATDIKGLDCTAWIMWNAIDMHVDSSDYGKSWVKKGSENDYLSVEAMEKAWASKTDKGYWGVAAADHDNSELILSKKYYGFGQYTRYIRPGMTIIGANSSTLAAYDPKNDQLVVVAINSAKKDKLAKIDLSGFDEITGKTKITAIRTSGSLEDGENWADVTDSDEISLSKAESAAFANLLGNSITTYIIDGIHYSGSGNGQQTAEKKTRTGAELAKLEEIKIERSMVSGSKPWADSADVDKAIDSNLHTYFDGLESGYLLVDLGKEEEIAAFSFAPRKGYTDRMLGGCFYGSKDGEKYTLLHEISSTEAPTAEVLTNVFAEEFQSKSNTFRYIKYEPADGACANIAEIKLYKELTGDNKTTYSTFSGTNGDVRYDNNGQVIQAHGGQVQKLTVDGVTKYYWIGEDKTSDYMPCPGVHMYSSTDLYNWKDEGLVLRTMTSEEDFDKDYFKSLYGGREDGKLSKEQKAIYTDLWAGTAEGGSVIERPKFLYNEKTGKYVMFFHADGQSPYASGSSSNYAKAKLGIAVSDTVNGPYKLLGTYLLHQDTGYDYGWDNENGHVRDMNVFKDDDGTAYVIYSSDGNANMYIAKLNDEYTGLESDEYTVNFVGASREAPAVFKRDGKYYMITSGCTGWAPNAAQYAVADSMLGEWTVKGNPCTDEGASTTYDTQSTCVVDLGKGRYMYMGDRWSNPDKGYLLRDSRYVWLPIEFTSDGGIRIFRYNDWDLSIFDSLKSYDIVTSLPTVVASVKELKENLPTDIEIKYQGEEETIKIPVVWNSIEADDNAIGEMEVSGLMENGRTIKFTANVVNDKLIYFFDCASTNADGQKIDNSFFNEVQNMQGKVLRNDETDQAYTSENHAGYTGNFTDDLGVKYSSDDIWGHGFWARSNKNIDYSFDLEAGKYAVDLGVSEWWNTTRPLRITVTDGDKDIAVKDFTLKYSDVENQQTVLFELEKKATVTVSLSKTGSADGVLSWIALIKTDLVKAEPTPEPTPTPAPAPQPSTSGSTGGSSSSASSGSSSSSSGSSSSTASSTTTTASTNTEAVTVPETQVPLAGDTNKPKTNGSTNKKQTKTEETAEEEVAEKEEVTEETSTEASEESSEVEETTPETSEETKEISEEEAPKSVLDKRDTSFAQKVAAVIVVLGAIAVIAYTTLLRKRNLKK